MIILFGDSWARQAYYHSTEANDNGYQHWYHKDITVALQENVWLHHFFEHNSSLNQANFGNTTHLIIQDLFHFDNISRLSEPVDCVVFQTDPLRIFAPRMDYRDQSIVWPRFREWCLQNQFDWHTQGLDDLVQVIYVDWYRSLENVQRLLQSRNAKNRLFVVGGVSAVHDCVVNTSIPVLIPSISQHFGLEQDLVFENRASLACFVDFWSRAVGQEQAQKLKKQWWVYENLLIAKENFWINNEQWFAGRHLTSRAMQQVARTIELRVDVGLQQGM